MASLDLPGNKTASKAFLLNSASWGMKAPKKGTRKNKTGQKVQDTSDTIKTFLQQFVLLAHR